jgi:PAS domain S-box-containing protein
VKRISIINIVLLYLAVFLLPIMIIGISSDFFIIKFLKMDIEKNNAARIDSIKNRIEDFLEMSENGMILVKNYIEMKNELYDESFYGYVKTNPAFKRLSGIFVTDIDGKIVNFTGIYPGGFDHLKYKDKVLDLKKVMGKNFVFNLIDDGNHGELFIILPVEFHGRHAGYIAGEMDLDMKNLLGTGFIIHPDDGHIVIDDGLGNVFFNPSGLKFHGKEIFSEIDGFDDDITIDKTSYVGSIRTIGATGWNLMLLEDRNSAYAKVNMVKKYVIIVIISGISLILISIFLAVFFLLRPISGFINDTAKIANGNRDVSLGNQPIREYFLLSRNFRRMLVQIRRREIELRKSESKYKKLVEDNMDFIFKVSSEFKFIFLSRSIENMLGCGIDDFLGDIDRYFEIRNKMNLKAMMITRKLFNDGIPPEPFLVTSTSEKGEKLILEIQETPVVRNGKVVEVQGIARDITTRYHFEQEVIYLKNFLYNIIESLPSALITVDKDGYIQMFNTSALKMLSKSSSEIYNKLLWTVDERFDGYRKHYDEAIAKNKRIEFSEKILIDGEQKYFNVAFYPLKRQEMKGTVLRMDDVTFIETAELQLRQSQKLETIGTMASGLAHDFNNILGSILGAVTLIVYNTRDNQQIKFDDLKEELDVISEASNKATGIIQQLMSLSKNHNSETETVDLVREINQVAGLCRTTFPKDIEIIVNITAQTAFVEASLSQMNQMILNLLVNARDSIKGKGWIKVGLKRYQADVFMRDRNKSGEDETYWQMTISDNGSGIPDEMKNSIFEPFFTTKVKNKGTGLGLTIVNNIVKHHKGFITFDSALDAGTTFRIYLPIKNEKADIEEGGKVASKKNDRPLILVVDDEKNIRVMTKKMLVEMGYEVIAVDNGFEAMEIFSFRHNQIDAVVLDLVMPDKSGKETFEEMKIIDAGVKVIMISGARKDPRIKEVLDQGAEVFLAKPFSFDDLSSAVKSILNN